MVENREIPPPEPPETGKFEEGDDKSFSQASYAAGGDFPYDLARIKSDSDKRAASLIGLWIVPTAIIAASILGFLLVMTLVWHILLPSDLHWLCRAELEKIQLSLFSVVFSALISPAFVKYFRNNRDDGDG